MNDSGWFSLLLVSMQYLLAFAFPIFLFNIILDKVRSRSWTPTSAKVTGSHTRKEFGQTAFYLDVAFVANDTTILSSVSITKDDLLKKYPKGQEISIFYNPRKPDKIFLNSPYSQFMWGFFVIAGICFAISVRQLTIEGWGFVKYPTIGLGIIGLKTYFEEFFSRN